MEIRIPNLKKLDNQYKAFENNVIALVKILPGITKVSTNFNTGDIEIFYNQDKLDAKTLMRWINTVIDVAIDSIDYIQANWETDLQGVMKKLAFVLQQKVQNNFTDNR